MTDEPDMNTLIRRRGRRPPPVEQSAEAPDDAAVEFGDADAGKGVAPVVTVGMNELIRHAFWHSP